MWLPWRYEFVDDSVDDVTGGNEFCQDLGQDVDAQQPGLCSVRSPDTVEQYRQLFHRLHQPEIIANGDFWWQQIHATTVTNIAAQL